MATLRRRLAGQGTSFRGIHRAVLAMEAKRLLRMGHSLPEIAEALHYADFRSFSRAFKTAAGLTPAAWRRAQGGKEAARSS